MTDDRKKTIRKRVLVILFIALNVGVIAWTAISEFGNHTEAAKLSEVKLQWIYVLPAALCWITAMAVETFKYMIVMKRTCGYCNPGLCFGTVFLGRYYDNITPSGIGGQPFQILYMKNAGVPTAESTSIPITGFLSMQYGFILLALFSFFGLKADLENNVIGISRYIGLVFYAIVPTIILCFTLLPKTTNRVFEFFFRLGVKLHICKDSHKAVQNIRENVGTYSKCVKWMLKSIPLTIVTMIFGIAYHFFLCCIPYFVLKAFGGNMEFIRCFVVTMSIYATITFIPTPGNAGAAESSFFLVFSELTSGYTFWAMMSWRFFTYYIFILFGAGIYLKKALTKRVVAKKQS